MASKTVIRPIHVFKPRVVRIFDLFFYLFTQLARYALQDIAKMAAPVWLLEQSHSVSVPRDIYHQTAQKKYQVHDQSTVTCM